MPPAKKPTWERRPQRKAVKGTSNDTAETTTTSESVPAQLKITAAERRQLFARLLWLGDAYPMVFAADASRNAELVQRLTSVYTSAHTKRVMQLDTAVGAAARRGVETRLHDCVGFLERARNPNRCGTHNGRRTRASTERVWRIRNASMGTCHSSDTAVAQLRCCRCRWMPHHMTGRCSVARWCRCARVRGVRESDTHRHT